MKVLFAIILSLMLLTVPAYAATIHGTVYDLSLVPIDALVEINSIPKQFYVAINGTYEFNINPGTYILKANTSEGSAVENIAIIEEGDYIIDIVIGLDIEEPIEFIDDTEVTDMSTDVNDLSHNLPTSSVIFGIIIVVILAVILIVLFVSRNNSKKSIKDDTDISDLEVRIIAILKEHSRITQKELRKMLPYSEAKISLIVAELEHEGRIKKIKKGRGNILVYIK